MIVTALVSIMLFQPVPTEVWYHQAVACAASAGLELQAVAEGEAAEALREELLTWGLVAANQGPPAGRSPQQVDELDMQAAEQFFRMMRDAEPETFAAHRAFCRQLTP